MIQATVRDCCKWFCAFGLVLFIAPLMLAAPARAVNLTLDVRDPGGNDIPARIQIMDSQGNTYPPDTNSVLMSHNDWPWMLAYFYHQGPVTVPLVPGTTTITAGRGFEIRPVRLTTNLVRDTSIVITLQRTYDMRSLGWYSSDTHVHMTHPPTDYNLTPGEMHEISQAEDLHLTWLLENGPYFTGGAYSGSTPDAVMYFSVEYRNQAYGHAPLLGLKQIWGLGCCTDPSAAYPMLSDSKEAWNPAWDEAMVLAHPVDGSKFFDDTGAWPSAGLAREVPVQAAAGDLTIYDIASYSNTGDITLSDYYNLLNCGFHIPPGAGTDAIMDRYWVRPAGGYRTYAYEGTQQPTPSLWVQAAKAGKVFVSNFPLIPQFTVDGNMAGSVIDRAGPSTQVNVNFTVESLVAVSTAKVIVNGTLAATLPVQSGINGSYGVFNVPLNLTESSWIAVRVDGTTDLRYVSNSALFAHTGPVYVRLNGLEAERTVAAGYFQDWCDSLKIFVENRGNWNNEGDHQHVLQRIAATKLVFGSHFHFPPSAFQLQSPAGGDSVTPGAQQRFDWTNATYTQPGDRIWYTLEIAQDTTFATGYKSTLLDSSQTTLVVPLPQGTCYWRVVAQERAGLTTVSSPPWSWFYLGQNTTAVAQNGSRDGRLPPPRLTVWPNPTAGRATFQWNQPVAAGGSFEIFDTGGRLLMRMAPSSAAAPVAGPFSCPTHCPTSYWDGRDSQGRQLASGLYWVRYVPPASTSSSGPAARPLTAKFLFLH